MTSGWLAARLRAGGRQRRWRVLIPVAVLLAAASVTVLTTVSARAAETLLSQGKPATASSTENAQGNPASAAFDGDTTSTRWSSTFADPRICTRPMRQTEDDDDEDEEERFLTGIKRH